MNDIQYYVLIRKEKIIEKNQIQEIEKIDLDLKETKLPFSDKLVDIYFISHNKNECIDYIKNLNSNIQECFEIEQVGAEIQYTAFIDILGFSEHIKNKITNHYQAEDFHDTFNEVIEYFKFEQQDKYYITDADYLKYIQIKYSWISDTFVICTEYIGDIKDNNETKIKVMMIFRLSIIIASIHHFMASKFGFIVRGGISSKYSCITNNFILGEGVSEAARLEKNIAIYPRVIFEENIISDEMYEIISRQYDDNDLNFVSKDCDGYYFVNYLAILQELPPMIGKMFKTNEYKINEMAIQNKLDVIKTYQEIVEIGLQIQNENIKVKYRWLNIYLGRVLLNEKYQQNIINIYTN